MSRTPCVWSFRQAMTSTSRRYSPEAFAPSSFFFLFSRCYVGGNSWRSASPVKASAKKRFLAGSCGIRSAGESKMVVVMKLKHGTRVHPEFEWHDHAHMLAFQVFIFGVFGHGMGARRCGRCANLRKPNSQSLMWDKLSSSWDGKRATTAVKI